MDIEELQTAIKVLEHGRQTHVDWIEYLKETPDADTELVGGIEIHEWYLTGYDPAIRALRLAVNPNIEAGANGEAVRWCETHEASGAEKCWAFVYGNAANDPLDTDCRMVERILLTSSGEPE